MSRPPLPQNLYDEFSFGMHSPYAIREFLKRTASWKSAPHYAILIGDASSDPRGISDDEAITGILAAARSCPGVISLSFGGTETDPLLQDAILTAFHNGCLVVAAAGNDGELGNPTTYPAAWPHVFTVGANYDSSAAIMTGRANGSPSSFRAARRASWNVTMRPFEPSIIDCSAWPRSRTPTWTSRPTASRRVITLWKIEACDQVKPS